MSPPTCSFSQYFWLLAFLAIPRELEDQLFHLHKKGFGATVLIDLIIHCFHRPLRPRKLPLGILWDPAVGRLLPQAAQWSLWITTWNEDWPSSLSWKWNLGVAQRVSRVCSMMWGKTYFQIQYTLNIYFKILMLTENYKMCHWQRAWRLSRLSLYLWVRKLKSKIRGSKYLVTDML